MKFNPHRHFLAALVVVWLCGLWGLRPALDYVRSQPTSDIVGSDPVDSGLITEGLEHTKSWRDTLRWWSGPWVAWVDGPDGSGHGVKFYRPLTSLVFWLEYRSFGRQGLTAFTAFHAASHLLVLGVALGFFGALLGLRLATVALCFFALHLPRVLFSLPSPMAALIEWKNGPDLWCAAFYLLALWSFLKFVRGGKSNFLVAAIALFVVALLFKEMAYTLPLLLVLILWFEGRMAGWKCVVPFWILAALAFAFRWWALQGFGFRFGSNGSWPQRWFMECIGGMPGANLSRGDGLPLAISCAAVALVVVKRPERLGLKSKRSWPCWLAVAIVIYAATEFLYAVNPGDAFLRLLLLELNHNSVWRMALFTFALLMLWVRFVVLRARVQMFAYGWILLTYLPLMTAPITEHAHYFVSFGWSLWLTWAMLEALSWPTEFCLQRSFENEFLENTCPFLKK